MTHLLAVAAVTYTSGCAGRHAQPTEPTHEAFHAIQVQENRIAEGTAIARRELEKAEPECPEVCRQAGEVCAAADALCDVAEPLDDADAHTRCARGRDECRALETRTTERCPPAACPGPATP